MSDNTKLVAGSGPTEPPASSNQFEVEVRDNFHYMMPEENYRHGLYGTYAEAVKVSKQIVLHSLLNLARPGMTGAELYRMFVMFGDDPWIWPKPEGEDFSAWDYAKSLCDSFGARTGAPAAT